MNLHRMIHLSIALALSMLLAATCQAAPLERLPYNHPGLAVDLGVGLWAWPIPCDADGDGDFDLIVSCPDKPSNGVWLFENRTGSTASNKFPVFAPARRLSGAVSYLMPSYVDGKIRVLSPGYEYENFPSTGIEVRKPLPLDASFYKPQWQQAKGPKLRHRQWRYADYDGDGSLDLVIGIEDWSDYGWDDAYDRQGRWQNGPLHGLVFWARNRATNEAPQYDAPTAIEAAGRPVDTFGCPSPNLADFDGDGDLDLLCGEFRDQFTYFRNVGSRTEPKYDAPRVVNNLRGRPVAMELEMIVPIAFDWDQDGDFDLIVGDEDGRVALVENTGKLDDLQTPVFNEPRYFQQQADTLKCGALATPFAVDWDGDGDTDIVSGNTAGFIEIFENLSGARVATPRWAAPRRLLVEGQPFRVMAGPNGSIQGPAEAKWGYTTINVADWDTDGLPDVLVNSIWGRVEWLKNVGSRSEPKFAAAQPIVVEYTSTTPKPAWVWWDPAPGELVTQWRTTPVVYDFTGDGLPDLAMLDPEGYLALFERVKRGDQLALAPPQRVFCNEKGEPLRLNAKSAGGSGRRKWCVADWDGDGRFDLLLNSSNADLLRQVDRVDGRWRFQHSGSLAQQNIEGHDVSPTVVDFDGDGTVDFLGGAEDGRFYFLKNPRATVAAADPAESAITDSEFIFDAAPFASCHASTVCETAARTLVAAWFGGTAEGRPDVGIWLSRRDGSGWSAPVEVANGVQYTRPDGSVHRHPCWNPVLFQPKNGPLMLFYKCGPGPSPWWGLLMTSTDDGRTWSQPRRLPEQIDGPVKNKPVELPDGNILCGCSTENVGWRVHFERSGDLGRTWWRTDAVNDGKEIGAIQPSILFLGGDKLLALGRSRQGRVYQILSNDLGKTWGEMTLTTLPNPNSGTDALTLTDGRHLLVYNPTERGRSPLTVALSTDGESWRDVIELENEPRMEFSYPAIVQSADGKVHITYTWKRKRIRHVVVEPGKLK